MDSFRELYLSEQEEKLDLQSELRDCKVCTIKFGIIAYLVSLIYEYESSIETFLFTDKSGN